MKKALAVCLAAAMTWLNAGAQTGDEQDPKSVTNRCTYHMEGLGGPPRADYDRRNAHSFSQVPPLASQLGAKALPASYAIAFAAPTTADDVKRVFKTDRVTAADVAEAARNKELLTQFGKAAADRALNKDSFTAFVSGTTASYIILVGHNKDGTFHFIDGSTADMEDLAEICDKHGKVAVFVSCRSKEHGVGSSRDLTFEEAFCIVVQIGKFLDSRKDSKASPQDLQAHFSSSEALVCNGRLRFFVLAACGTAGVLLAVEAVEKTSKN